MDPRWVVEVPDVEAFMELLEPGDLEALVAEILERASVGADVKWDDNGLTVIHPGKRNTYKLSGQQVTDLLQSVFELGAHLVAEHGFVLAWAELDGLEIAVVPRQAWDALPEDARRGYAIVEPHARPVTG